MNELRRDAVGAIRRHLFFAAVFSALVNILYLSPTLYMLQIYDRVLPTGGELTLLFVTLVIFLALAVLAMLDSLRGRLLVRAGMALDQRFAGEALSRQMTASVWRTTSKSRMAWKARGWPPSSLAVICRESTSPANF